MEYIINIYKTTRGKSPFWIWLNRLSNIKTRVAIELRIDRLELGNFGNCKALGSGLYELKIDVGPGYRIYFCRIGQRIILLLNAGNKRSQQKDILKAREYFKDYKLRGQKND